MDQLANTNPEYGGVEKGRTWKVSNAKIQTWIATTLYIKYKPKNEEEAEGLVERKRVKFRQMEGRDGFALATLYDRNNKVIGQTSILNFIEYENNDTTDDSELPVLSKSADVGAGTEGESSIDGIKNGTSKTRKRSNRTKVATASSDGSSDTGGEQATAKS